MGDSNSSETSSCPPVNIDREPASEENIMSRVPVGDRSLSVPASEQITSDGKSVVADYSDGDNSVAVFSSTDEQF
ncbi:hypothetical protein SARC_02615 [Sphaeroforma arctica JP610]|uniref:Uncharacterized protein n=1 Tax=Sphaeroforma arctica JP610 TaxID=667725 RepID=A0A0L0G8J4_9EUKA|nr:hypothetical protein SARC_02615 [Sphaeroforma arctica JP610]KNC85196.1 hypothetical protein SARC_02615 [Sphaeroforma arctica JP610]|eukprot:XP_014159098.1 hypothetical protein SARC_02615 [Sphaeroforma arctica JP610]